MRFHRSLMWSDSFPGGLQCAHVRDYVVEAQAITYNYSESPLHTHIDGGHWNEAK